MVLNCKTIFKKKQASKQANKENLRKQAFLSSKQANRSEVFRTCTVVLGSHTSIVVLPGGQILVIHHTFKGDRGTYRSI